ncbi:MAG: putative glycoside hydrolase [Actinobacteria bacterium]|nr:putative glycoside hydrolase [Actinomycetota bacterium]
MTGMLADIRREMRGLPAEWPVIRGVYSTMWSFAGSRWEELMDLVRTTEINAIVIDVKDDDGRVAWRGSDVAVARETGADSHTMFQKTAARRRIQELRDAGGYPIARIVCFKDPIAAPAMPQLAIRSPDGGVWRDRKGLGWLDANKQETWDYLVDLGREAARMGFLEVQFDYVRFPTDGNTTSAVYDDGKGVDPARIREFLAYAREELHGEGVRISADIFGLTTYKAEGEGDGDGTGQLFEDVISEVDYVSPMVYPSHYYPGNYGLSNPEAAPYQVVVNAMREAQERVDGYRAQVRPWLEDFSLTVPHHPGRVADQLRATYENGVSSWMLWNANNRYSRAALGPDESFEQAGS